MAAIAFLRPARPALRLDPSADELLALGAHLAFPRGLIARGEVTVAGPAEDGLEEIVVSPHRDAAQAELAMRSDPCVQAGMLDSGGVAVPAESSEDNDCLLYTSPSPRDLSTSRMPSSA